MGVPDDATLVRDDDLVWHYEWCDTLPEDFSPFATREGIPESGFSMGEPCPECIEGDHETN